MKIYIYHNPRCRKSRAGLEMLKSKTEEFEIIEYLKSGIDAKTIIKLSKMINIPVADMVRTQEEYFKKELKGRLFSTEEWAQIISENLKLLRRPIVVKGNKAVIVESVDDIEKLF